MGRDKIENEDLIKFGWAQDVWFHVSNLSSAHVYLRMEDGMTLKQIPPRQYSDRREQGVRAQGRALQLQSDHSQPTALVAHRMRRQSVKC